MSLSRKIAACVVIQEVAIDALVERLREYNLLALLPSIKEEVAKLQTKKLSEGTIAIESPFELSTEAIVKIKRIVGNDLAETEVTINKEILSGFKARFKGKLYDGSGERIIKQLTNH